MSGQFAKWNVQTNQIASDFDLVLINRNQVIMARRLTHGPNGVDVYLSGSLEPLTLRTHFSEFETWLLEGDNL